MGTLGLKKKACVRGHINPLRYSRGACIQCQKETAKQRYQSDRARRIERAIAANKADPDARRDYGRATRMKVTVDQIRSAIKRANGHCEACGKPITNKTACVDHCHATGNIRGVLCRFCNALEGMLNKKAERVRQVMAYLEMAESRERAVFP